jgi:dTDP-4-dehydrorhamnose reductase
MKILKKLLDEICIMTVPAIGSHSQLGREMQRQLKEKEIVLNEYDVPASDISNKVYQYSILNDELYDADINCSVYSNLIM